ncbi:MAG TPA: holo-ACP synthase [Anaerolineaceae bacterium]|jgi:holo-[acyl-carrier protein] synthase|nr:holo-ACP synthase [Anaerolineaceae bacterium]
MRTGIDLIEIERLEQLNPNIRRRFLARVFTAAELAQAGESFASLAGRFAAKEAVAKALGTGIGPIGWQDIEILTLTSGEPQVYLHGAACSLAAQLGLAEWSLSITHTRTLAAAFVVAQDAPEARG